MARGILKVIRTTVSSALKFVAFKVFERGCRVRVSQPNCSPLSMIDLQGKRCTFMRTSMHLSNMMVELTTPGVEVGCCTACYPTRHVQFDPDICSISLIEASKVAGSTSCKAGDLIAAWAEPQCMGPSSIQFHADLAKEHDSEEKKRFRTINYADVNANGEAVGHAESGSNTSHFHSHGGFMARSASLRSELDWVKPQSAKSYTKLGDSINTAHVHPYQSTSAIGQLAQDRGVKLVIGCVMQLNYNDKGTEVESLTYKLTDDDEEMIIPLSDVVIPTGPWTRSLLIEAPIKVSRINSIVVRPKRTISAFVMFPELYPHIARNRYHRRFTLGQMAHCIRAGPVRATYLCHRQVTWSRLMKWSVRPYTKTSVVYQWKSTMGRWSLFSKLATDRLWCVAGVRLDP